MLAECSAAEIRKRIADPRSDEGEEIEIFSLIHTAQKYHSAEGKIHIQAHGEDKEQMLRRKFTA